MARERRQARRARTKSSGVQTEDDIQAAEWAIRLDGEPLGAAEEQALDAWLAAEPRRRGALLRAEAALAYLDRGRALGEGTAEDPLSGQTDAAAEASETGAMPRFGRRAFLIGGSLSAVAASGALAVFLTQPRPLVIETALGEVRRVPLADGSVASVNTSTRLAVVLRDKSREIKLEDGEVWFQVAHDKTRPFIVEAGPVRVQAVGTAFSVRRREGGADVLVTEGVVETWVVDHPERRTRIAAGSKSFVPDRALGREVVKAAGDIDRALAWRTGELALNGESLAFAAGELNRYNKRKLVIVGDALGREPMVGYFRADQPEDFARAAASLTGARVEIEGDEVRLSR